MKQLDLLAAVSNHCQFVTHHLETTVWHFIRKRKTIWIFCCTAGTTFQATSNVLLLHMIRISFCHIILRTRNCQRSGSVRGYQPSCWQRGPGRQSNQKVNVQQLIQGPNEGLWIWVLKLGFTIRVAQVDRCRRMQEACWCQKFNKLVGQTLPLSCHTAFSILNSVLNCSRPSHNTPAKQLVKTPQYP